MKKTVTERTPMICPVCSGTGQVAPWFYGQVIQSTCSNNNVTCKTCNGFGLVMKEMVTTNQDITELLVYKNELFKQDILIERLYTFLTKVTSAMILTPKQKEELEELLDALQKNMFKGKC